jgi:RNA polymerase sigma-70 factor, ECF subfamily
VDDGIPPPVPATRARSTPFELHVLPEIEVLYRVARSLTRHPADAEDLVQDTLLRAHRSIGTFDGRHPRAWLLTIMRNAHLNRLRRPRPELMHDADEAALAASAANDAPDGFVDHALDREVVRALDDLPAKFRQVIEIVDMEGRSYATAAEMLGVPIGTVMSRLHRARARIRTHLLHAGVTPGSPG